MGLSAVGGLVKQLHICGMGAHREHTPLSPTLRNEENDIDLSPRKI